MRLLILMFSLWALAYAKPEMYKEKEDFQFSRSSSDDGTKSGFYGAQRGNMGGNYEKAHNMDSYAQHQMSTLVRQVDGELGEGASTKTGSVFTAGNSRGIYGSGNYDLSNLKGRNFEEGTSYDDSQSQSSFLAENSGYTGNSFSAANNARYSVSQQRASGVNSGYSASQLRASGVNTGYSDSQVRASGVNSGYSDSQLRVSGVNSGYHQTGLASQYGQFDNQQAESQYNGASNYEYGGQGASNYKYYSHGGSQARSEYDNSNANLHSISNYDSGSKSRLVTTPIRFYIRPGTRVIVPVSAQAYDSSQSALIRDQNAVNTDTELVSNSGQRINVIKPVSNAKHYETSYRYRKEWEKHDTQPVTVMPTENPFPQNSELYEDSQISQSTDQQHQTEVDSTNAHTSNINSAYSSNVNSGFSSGYSANTRTAAANRLQYQSNVQSSGANTASNAYRFNTQNSDAAAANLDTLVDVNTKPKSYQTSYSYHKSWERRGDPYVIKPVGGDLTGQSSQRLIAASTDQDVHSSNHYSNQYDQIRQSQCDLTCHLRKRRSYNMEQYSQQMDQEQFSQQNMNGWSSDVNQPPNKWDDIENLGQQTQNQWGNLEDLGQQTQNSWHNLETLSQQSEGGLEDLGQQTQNTWNNLESLDQQPQSNFEGMSQQSQSQLENLDTLGQQTQNTWNNLETFNQQSQGGLEDLGQQTQNTWNNLESLNQQPQSDFEGMGQSQSQLDNLDALGQQTQNTWNNLETFSPQSQGGLEDLGQQTQTQFDNLENLGQETQNTWTNLESLNQKPQNTFEVIGQESQSQLDNVESLGQEIQNTWDNLESLNQQPQSNTEELGQHSQSKLDNLEGLGQETQNTWNQMESFNQHPHSEIEELGQQTQGQLDHFENAGQQTQTNWGKFEHMTPETQSNSNDQQNINIWNKIEDQDSRKTEEQTQHIKVEYLDHHNHNNNDNSDQTMFHHHTETGNNLWNKIYHFESQQNTEDHYSNNQHVGFNQDFMHIQQNQNDWNKFTGSFNQDNSNPWDSLFKEFDTNNNKKENDVKENTMDNIEKNIWDTIDKWSIESDKKTDNDNNKQYFNSNQNWEESHSTNNNNNYYSTHHFHHSYNFEHSKETLTEKSVDQSTEPNENTEAVLSTITISNTTENNKNNDEREDKIESHQNHPVVDINRGDIGPEEVPNDTNEQSNDKEALNKLYKTQEEIESLSLTESNKNQYNNVLEKESRALSTADSEQRTKSTSTTIKSTNIDSENSYKDFITHYDQINAKEYETQSNIKPSSIEQIPDLQGAQNTEIQLPENDQQQQNLEESFVNSELQNSNMQEIFDFGQQVQEPFNENMHELSQKESNTFDKDSLDEQSQKQLLDENQNNDSLNENQEIMQVEKVSNNLQSVPKDQDTVEQPVEPTEKPGFWGSVWKKTVNAKDSVVSWFKN